MLYIILLVNLLVTVLVEGIAILVIFRNWKFVYYSFLSNLLTNPALNLIMIVIGGFLGPEYYYVLLIILELLVVLIEACIYKALCDFSFTKSLLVSLLANVLSFCTGLIVLAVLMN